MAWLPYDSFTGESYSSMRATTFLPCFDSRMPMRLSKELISIPRLAVKGDKGKGNVSLTW